MKSIAFGILTVIGVISACSPKTTAVTEKESTETVTTTPENTERLTPCTTFNDLDYIKKDEAENAYVLYKDYLKIKDYKSAYHYWNVAYSYAPGSNGRVTSQFDDGVEIYKYLFNNTDNTELKKSYVDTVNMIYNKKIECFGDRDGVAARKAFEFYYNFKDYISEDNLFKTFTEALEAKPNKADYFIINPFTRMLYDRTLDDKIDHTSASNYAMQVLNSINYGLSTSKGEYLDAWKVVDEYSTPLLESLEGYEGFYDCEYYTSKYYNLYLENKNSCDYVKLAYSRMLRGGCNKDASEIKELEQRLKSDCYEAPPASDDIKCGNDAYTSGDYIGAIKCYDSFISKSTDPEKTAKIQILVSKIYYRDLKNYSKSRKYALDAAANKPGWGEPYMIIGKLYASSGPLCGPGRGWDSQIVTWPAIDKFEYAKKIDPSVTKEANQLIATYSQYMPSREDLHLRTDIHEGDNFKVGCWIQENTTVRAAPK